MFKQRFQAFKLSSLSFIGIFFISLIAGCEPSVSDSSSGVVAIEKDSAVSTEDAAEGFTEDNSLIYFDGTKVLSPKISSLSAPYTIFVSFRSDDPQSAEQEVSEFSPPMPFLAGDFVVYQQKARYIIGTNGRNVAEGGAASSRQSLILSVDSTGVGRVFIEGKEVWTGDVGETRPVIIGKGFQKRFWTGSVYQFQIYGEAVQTPDEMLNDSLLLFDIFDVEEN